MNVGDKVWFLYDQGKVLSGTVLRINAKTLTIEHPCLGTFRVLPDKCATAQQEVAFVWEAWRGRNGRGGYRVERELYPQRRCTPDKMRKVDTWWDPRSCGYVIEDSYGVLDPRFDPHWVPPPRIPCRFHSEPGEK